MKQMATASMFSCLIFAGFLDDSEPDMPRDDGM
jgi:hypothetical protein